VLEDKSVDNSTAAQKQPHYYLDQAFDLGTNSSLKGIGDPAPILECRLSNVTGITSGLMPTFDYATGISISNLMVKGCQLGINLGSWSQVCDVSDVEVRNNSEVGLWTNCQNSTLINVMASSNGQQGFYANVNYLNFVNCTSIYNGQEGLNINSGPSHISLTRFVAAYNGAYGISNTANFFYVNDSVIEHNLGGITLVWIGHPVYITNTLMRYNNFVGLDSGGTTTVADSCICSNNGYENVECDGFSGSVDLTIVNTAATGIDTDCTPQSGTAITCTAAATSSICQYPSWYTPVQAPANTTSTGSIASTTGIVNSTSKTATASQTQTGQTQTGQTIPETITVVVVCGDCEQTPAEAPLCLFHFWITFASLLLLFAN